MLFVKNYDDYTSYVEYDCDSGFCTISSIHVVPKFNPELDCVSIAKKLLKKYEKDHKLLYDDIEEFGDLIQRAQIRG